MNNSQLMLLSIYKDHLYAVVLQRMGHYCGYIRFEDGEKSLFEKARNEYEENCDVSFVECHGGVTFVSRENGEWVLPEGNWIGFDCAHCGDGIDAYAVEKIFGKEAAEEAKSCHFPVENEKVFTPKIVAKMCKDIISQIEKLNKED